MSDLAQALSSHFKLPRGHDNLPIVAVPNTGRDNGRYQLAKAMHDFGCRRGVEIGVGIGVSAKIWHDANPTLELIGIDPYIVGRSTRQERYYGRAMKVFTKLGFKLMRTTSMEAVDTFDEGSLDFVHIDGHHGFDFVMQDIIKWVPKVKRDGLVLCHDYCALENGGVVNAVNAYVQSHRIDPWYVTRDCNPTAFWQRTAEHA